jgi:hypothetical protein
MLQKQHTRFEYPLGGCAVVGDSLTIFREAEIVAGTEATPVYPSPSACALGGTGEGGLDEGSSLVIGERGG